MAEIVVTRLTPVFAAQIDGADITRALDDESQIAFSRRFGNLEVTRNMNPAAGTPFARQSNLDIKTGEVIPQGDRRIVDQLANMLWHSDSSFKTVPALCSLLSARIIPPEGGATELAGMRGGYAALPESTKRRIETLVVVHDFAWSRDQVLDHATQPAFVYRHEWREGDLVVWDNRSVLHRATPYDSVRDKRLMQRTTISGDPAEIAAVVG